MKIRKVHTGPFTEQPYYADQEFESICSAELHRVGLFPTSPQAVRIDRFVEKRFGQPRYEDLPNGLLGFTKFGPNGVEAIVLSRQLSHEQTVVAERRINTTLAHESGHGLLHAHLFALELRQPTLSLFADALDHKQQKILCRTHGIQDSGESESDVGYDGRWWEYQANRMIGPLLLPRPLVTQALEPLLRSQGTLSAKVLEPFLRQEAVRILAATFNVNPQVARIRLKALFPPSPERQLSLQGLTG